jgi:hypothetical protein
LLSVKAHQVALSSCKAAVALLHGISVLERLPTSDILPAYSPRVLRKPLSDTRGSLKVARLFGFDDKAQNSCMVASCRGFLWSTRDGIIAMPTTQAKAPYDWRRDLVYPTKRQRLYHPTCDAYWGRFGSEATLPTSLMAPHCPHRSTARLTPHWYPRDPTSRSIFSVKHLEDAAIVAIVPVSGPGTFVR